MTYLITDKDYYERTQGIDTKGIEESLVHLLYEKHMKIATAESCTGGMISQRITNVSGASNVFDCGICSYANIIKEKLLGVSNKILSTYGAVSKETATQMCQGIMKVAYSDIGLSTTGIAGPTGGSKDKPVGLVFIGIATKTHTTIYRAEFCHYAQHSRDEVRTMTTNLAMLLATEELSKL